MREDHELIGEDKDFDDVEGNNKPKWLTITQDHWDGFIWSIRRFIKKIRNVIRWLPTIWKDEDWDDFYIFEVLKVKLKHQSEYIKKRDYHVGALYESQRMETCIRLIEKIQSEEYTIEYHNEFVKKWGEAKWSFVPLSKEMQEKTNCKGCSELIISYPNVKSPQDKIDCDKEMFDGIKKGQDKHERARKLLFRILDKHIFNWWD